MIIVKVPTAAPNHHWRISVRYSRSRSAVSRSRADAPTGGGASTNPYPADATAARTAPRSAVAGTYSTSASSLPMLTWAPRTPGVARSACSMRVTHDAQVMPRIPNRILALPVRYPAALRAS